jgi:LEA14-like dessication related protein
MRPARATLLLAVLALSACRLRPEPPTITPQSAQVVGASSAGLSLRLALSAHNPNRIPLTARWVRAHVVLGGRDLGTTQVATPLTLPARGDAVVSTDVIVGWMDLPALIAQTAFTPAVPLHVDGTVGVGLRGANVTVPFQLDTTMPQQVLVNAASNSLPAFPGM